MSVELGTAYAELKLKTKDFSSNLKSAETELDAFKNKANLVADGFNAAGASLTKAGSTLTKTVTAPVIALGTAAVKTTATFDESMSKVQALSGATGKEFDALREKAIEMGAKTAFSASESADAFSYMALAGWDTEQMLSGISGVLNLAASSQMGLAEASDMVTDYLTAFGLEAEHAGVMADQLAYAQANSNTTTAQLGEAFKNSAAQMHTAGQTMETTTAFLEAMANQGLKGSEAGTALSATIRDITQKMYTYQDANEAAQAAADGFTSVTGDMNDVIGVSTIEIGKMLVPVSDAQGNFRNLTDIMADVEKATYGMGSAEKSAALLSTFTARSIKAVSMSLTEGTDNIKDYEKALYDVDGTAEDMANTMLNNLNGQITILKSTIETLLIQIGDLLMPTISKIVEKIRQLVVYFTSLDEEQKKQIMKWAGIAAAIGPVLLVLGKLLTGVGGIISTGTKFLTWSSSIAKAFGLISTGAGGVTAGLGAIISAAAPIAAIVAAVVALGVAFKKLYDQNGAFTASVDKLSASLKNGLESAINSVKEIINFVAERMQPVIETIKNSFDFTAVDNAMAGLVDAFGAMLDALKPIADFIIKVVIGQIVAFLAPAILAIIGVINGVVKALAPLIKTITSVMDVIRDVANIITGIVEGIVTGDFSKLKAAWKSLKEDLVQVLVNLIDTVVAFVAGFFEGVFVTVESFTGGLLTKIAEFFVNLWDKIVTFFTKTIPEAFGNFVNVTVPEFINNVKNWFDQLPYNIGYAIGQALVKIKQWGTDMLNYIAKQIPIIINKIVDFFRTLPSKIYTWLTSTLQKVKTWGTDMLRTATTIATNFVNNFINLIKTLPDKVYNWIKQIPGKVTSVAGEMYKAGTELFNKLWEGMKAIWDKITGWFEGVMDKVKDFIKGIKDGMSSAEKSAEGADSGSHADGLAYVPYNGYRATLHEGERVLTRNEAEVYNKGGSGFTIIFNSPKAIDTYEANKLFRETVRKLDEGFA